MDRWLHRSNKKKEYYARITDLKKYPEACLADNVVQSHCYWITLSPSTGYTHRGQSACQPPHIPLTCFYRRRSVIYSVCVCECVLYLYKALGINLLPCFKHIYSQMNGCVQSCEKTTMSWYIGACTLTGNA